MATPVNSTIGSSGRNYGTLALWRASIAVSTSGNLVTEDKYYVGNCYNDSEFVNDTAALGGHTTDATHTITLTAAAGQSFADHANVQTNALTYDPTKGVACRSTLNFHENGPVNVSDSYVTISRLQMKRTALYQVCVWGTEGSNYLTITKNLMVGGDSATPVVKLTGYTTGLIFTNNMVITQNSNGGGLQYQNNQGTGSASFAYNTFVAYSDVGGTWAVYGNYNTNTMSNCAFFGFTNVRAGGGSHVFINCMTDSASPPSGCTQVTYANQFVNTTSSAPDFRVKAGANLINAGTTDATYAPTDIVGTARPQGAAYDIGCWEYVPTGPPPYRPRVVRWG